MPPPPPPPAAARQTDASASRAVDTAGLRSRQPQSTAAVDATRSRTVVGDSDVPHGTATVDNNKTASTVSSLTSSMATTGSHNKVTVSWNETFQRDEEIERQIRNELATEANRAGREGRWPQLKLYNFDQLPRYLQDNEYIRGGYRVFYSYRDNWRSIFMLHNETGNIWTHLVGFWMFIGLMVYAHMTLPEHAALADHLAFASYFLCAAACFLFSTLFHTHFCHSRRAYVTFGCLDYAGISTLICGSACLVTYFGFYCDAVPRITWITFTVLTASVGIVGPFHPAWALGSFRKWRTLIYIASCLASASPVVHFVARHGWPVDLDLGIYWVWLAMVGLYLGGAAMYAYRIPERWFPGKLDVFLHSHQFWHVAVVGACYAHYSASWRLLEWRLRQTVCVQ